METDLPKRYEKEVKEFRSVVLTLECASEVLGELVCWAPTLECVSQQVWAGPENLHFSQIPRRC